MLATSLPFVYSIKVIFLTESPMKQRVYTGLRLKTHFKQALFNST